MPHRIIYRIAYRTATIFILMFIIIGLRVQAISAQEAQGFWAEQQQIPDYDLDAFAPVMVVDSAGTVHAFSVERPFAEAPQDLFHRTWTPETGWSDPNNVLLAPSPFPPTILGVYIDEHDTIHLTLYVGNQDVADLYYSSSPAITAHLATSWLQPTAIVKGVGPLAIGALQGDGHGNLMAIYQSRDYGVGLYYVTSPDYGETWSEPDIVQLVYRKDVWPAALNTFVDVDGVLHAVWSFWSDRGRGEEIYYTQTELRWQDHENHWREPILLAAKEEEDYEADWPTVMKYKDDLIVIYQDSFPATRFFRLSKDNGLTWSEPVHPWPHIGEYAEAVMLLDSNGDLHTVMGNRTADCCHGMWHAKWMDGYWSDLEPMIFGPKSPSFDPSGPSAVITRGNYLLVAWRTDTLPEDRNGAWYTFGRLNAPELAVVPLPTSTFTPTPYFTPTPLPPTATPAPDKAFYSQFDDPNLMHANNPGMPLIWAAAPATLLIALVMLLRGVSARRRW